MKARATALTAEERAAMEARAQAWLEPDHTQPDRTVTRDNALNEEHLALDVVVLLSEVQRLRQKIYAMWRFGEWVNDNNESDFEEG